MMIDIKIPPLSESVASATLMAWRRQTGERVAREEGLIDIETDKIVLELTAPEAGILTEILKHNGEEVVSGEVIARIDTEAAALMPEMPRTLPPEAPVLPPAQEKPEAFEASRGFVMPAARGILAEKGLSAAEVAGTGRGGRITKEDARAARPLPPADTKTPESPVANNASCARFTLSPAPVVDFPLDERPEQRVPMSRLRARIAERLVQSQSTNAILTTFNEVNMAPVMALRARYAENFEKTHGVRLGFMSFFVKAAVAALQKFPILNASVDGNDIVYHGYIDIGIAVGSPRGLSVPILRDADRMSMADAEKKIAEFGRKARDGKLSLEELTGGTFSISNGGIFGSMLSTPIINPPQSAILGVHATKDRAVVENGEIVIRPMNYLALSYDHRIIDGREAVLALTAIKETLEDPSRLLLGI